MLSDRVMAEMVQPDEEQPERAARMVTTSIMGTTGSHWRPTKSGPELFRAPGHSRRLTLKGLCGHLPGHWYSFDLNLPWQRNGRNRCGDLQHAIHEFGVYLLGVHALGEL